MSSGLLSNNNHEEGLKMEIAEERNEYIPGFHTKVDNYLQYAPIALCYGLDALGYHGRNNVKQQTILLLQSELIMTGLVTGLKYTTKQMRPDQSRANSFPSGHTAQAFAAASFFSLEYQSKFHWVPYVSYGIASGVGLLRMANNKHYVSDVLMGAGIGILSTRLVYWNQERIKRKHQVRSTIPM
jgi:membrane-associated phospholipid phosphatase